MIDLVKRLREILENATPGPWVACKGDPDDGPEDVVMAGDRYIASCHEGLRERAESNAALIAFAPDLASEIIVKSDIIGAHVEEIVRLTRENENLRQIERNVQAAREHEHQRAERALAEIARLREQMKDREHD